MIGKPYLIVNESRYVKLEWNRNLYIPLIPDKPYRFIVLLPGTAVTPYQLRKAILNIILSRGEVRQYHYAPYGRHKNLDDKIAPASTFNMVAEYPVPNCGTCKSPLHLRTTDEEWYCMNCGRYQKMDKTLKALLSRMERSDITIASLIVFSIIFFTGYMLFNLLFEYYSALAPDFFLFFSLVVLLTFGLSILSARRPGRIWRTS